MEERYFSEKVAKWYGEHKRELPWRATRDAYKIWLSEIILQQTRVNQGLPYYLRFLEKFPDIFSLASATEEEVLRLWQGLGYYSRARNLHKCAKSIVSQHKGIFPSTFQELLKLPGIGSYTAAAIASFTVQETVPVVDGNVHRVLARIFGITVEVNSPQGKKMFWEQAMKLMPATNPDLHNQAIMDFGATWCSPKQPKCGDCPFNQTCVANRESLQHVLPVKAKSKKTKRRYFYYFVVKKGKSLLMKKREARDIWHGLYDFYLVEKSRAYQPVQVIRNTPFLKKIFSSPEDLDVSNEYKHILSHQTIISRFTIIEEKNNLTGVEEEEMQYYSLKKIHDLPKPVLITRFLTDYNFL